MQQAEQLRAQIRALRKELNKVNPSAARTRGTSDYEAFLNFKKMGKDVVNVGWANSKPSAESFFEGQRRKLERGLIKNNPYEDWQIDDTRDIDGDNKPDIIIKNAQGVPKIINGQTIKRSRHPKREAYYSEIPDKAERINYNKLVKAGEAKPFSKQFNAFTITQTPDGVVISNADERNTTKATPYRLFSQKFFSPIWEHLKKLLPENMPNTEKMAMYRTLLSTMWSRIKDVVYGILGVAKPNNDEDIKYVENKKSFKNQLKDIIVELFEDPNKFYNDALSIIISLAPQLENYIRENRETIYDDLLKAMFNVPDRLYKKNQSGPQQYGFGKRPRIPNIRGEEPEPVFEQGDDWEQPRVRQFGDFTEFDE